MLTDVTPLSRGLLRDDRHDAGVVVVVARSTTARSSSALPAPRRTPLATAEERGGTS